LIPVQRYNAVDRLVLADAAQAGPAHSDLMNRAAPMRRAPGPSH